MEGKPEKTIEQLDVDRFRAHTGEYSIVDARNAGEVEKQGKKFSAAINIPLPELMGRTNEIPENKHVVVYCAGGYRSAAAASIVRAALPASVAVFDLSGAVADF